MIDNKYTLKTEEGRKNLREYAKKYNENNDKDVLFKHIGIDEALAMCNVEEFIKTKSQVAEIVREALEIGLTTTNFKSNTIFTFTRNHLKKAGYNSIIRMQVENYIKFRLHMTDKEINETISDQEFKNIITLSYGGDIVYYDTIQEKELNKTQITAYLNYMANKIVLIGG